ncbi:hypothetical protein BOTBODRAFT_182172 [Botryobasidium botryosum FD-172 SS1]|uniref:Uncharacterized protein n=1 Tax=Botryobasidium botryosum (strain FD-172 SS1) TaxID=930990 RepID=A0A067M1Y8_BOTB1|nr:hypothetical protein BOTBODRAFT_182172 [Botryobasidium botryosum FD-172 SS1]
MSENTERTILTLRLMERTRRLMAEAAKLGLEIGMNANAEQTGKVSLLPALDLLVGRHAASTFSAENGIFAIGEPAVLALQRRAGDGLRTGNFARASYFLGKARNDPTWILSCDCYRLVGACNMWLSGS